MSKCATFVPPIDLSAVIYCPRYEENMLISTCRTRRELFGQHPACDACLSLYGGE